MHMFYRVLKGIYQFAANLLSYIPTKYYWNQSTSDLVIAKSKRVNFFLKHSVVLIRQCWSFTLHKQHIVHIHSCRQLQLTDEIVVSLWLTTSLRLDNFSSTSACRSAFDFSSFSTAAVYNCTTLSCYYYVTPTITVLYISCELIGCWCWWNHSFTLSLITHRSDRH